MSKPIIYQMLPRLWGNQNDKLKQNGSLEQNKSGKFSDIDQACFDYFKSLGISHIWYTGVLRHATVECTDGCQPSSDEWVKGRAGSPYSITNYFDVNPYLADKYQDRMKEFEDLIERTHKNGLKVIIDFVPNHVARDYGKFSKPGDDFFGKYDDTNNNFKPENDFFYYPNQNLKLPIEALEKVEHTEQEYIEYPAKASGNCYSPNPGINDWYDTIKLNYCDYHTPTWDRMLDIIRYWISMGVDGFRCDMVELVPPEFFTWLIDNIKQDYPDVIFIAELYQKSQYSYYIHQVKFDYLYDKSGLYDSLRSIVQKNTNDNGVPIEQWQSTKLITWNWQQLNDLQPRMLNFLENHDEQRFASDFFGLNPLNAMAALHISLLFNTAPFMLYFGQEVGERGMDQEGLSGLDGRTSIFDWWSPSNIRDLYSFIHGRSNLTEQEAECLKRYKELLVFASSTPAITKGRTYDLCYCNYSSNGFNQDKHFAFLRSYEKDIYLIVCNFGSLDSNIEITIPKHAFDWLGIEQTDDLNSNNPILTKVNAMDGVILHIAK